VATAAVLGIALEAHTFGDASPGDRSDMSAVQRSGPQLIDEMRTVLGGEFGGGWIAGTPDGEVVHIAVTNPSPENRQKVADAAAKLGLSGMEQVDVVRYSHKQLIGFYETVGTIASGIDGVTGWGVQVDQNKVELILSGPQDGLVDRIEAVLPADAFMITVDPGSALVGL
jgi:acylphosphatase